jgi:hypothetical protein
MRKHIVLAAASLAFLLCQSVPGRTQSYTYDFGYFDYFSLESAGPNFTRGFFSPSLYLACSQAIPKTRIRRDALAVLRTVRCDTGETVIGGGIPIGTSVVYEFGPSTGARAAIHLSRGIPADCGAFANLDAENLSSRRVRFTIRWQRPSDGALIDYPYTFAPRQIQRSLLRCAFGTSWVQDAQFAIVSRKGKKQSKRHRR